MRKQSRRVLVIGSPTGFTKLFEELEARGYHFHYVADTQAARTYLLRHPAEVVLLSLPEGSNVAGALAWLEAAKTEWPVAVISREDNVPLYLTAMERGAFDYFTCHTSLGEVRRVLENAIRWHQLRVA